MNETSLEMPLAPLGQVEATSSNGDSAAVAAWPRLKIAITERLVAAADAQPQIVSATLTGSFPSSDSPTAMSDIDFVVVVDHLNTSLYQQLLGCFFDALAPLLNDHGYQLRINATLGPLKLNDPGVAVLHLMLYSRSAHVEHAILSPFTCLDWQRSTTYSKHCLAEIFPIFRLQPHHFLSARRSLKDYLRDFDAGVVSYRDLCCTDDGYCEVKRSKPMTHRDRHEFAYHVLRFLTQNLVKLVRRDNIALATDSLLREYFAVFPENCRDVGMFFRALRAAKLDGEFALGAAQLDRELRAFVDGFERQFRRMFFDRATRHLVFRHARTELNHDASGERLFLGASDPPVAPATEEDYQLLAQNIAELQPREAFASPLLRCRQTLQRAIQGVPLVSIAYDDRIREIEYGKFEGLSVSQARQSHAGIFAAWERSEDPRFPDGENAQDVFQRAQAFADEHWRHATGPTVTCTHNVVLRALVGHALGIPRGHWHRLEIPHLSPITFVATRDQGIFVDISPEVSRQMFAHFIR